MHLLPRRPARVAVAEELCRAGADLLVGVLRQAPAGGWRGCRRRARARPRRRRAARAAGSCTRASPASRRSARPACTTPTATAAAARPPAPVDPASAATAARCTSGGWRGSSSSASNVLHRVEVVEAEQPDRARALGRRVRSPASLRDAARTARRSAASTAASRFAACGACVHLRRSPSPRPAATLSAPPARSCQQRDDAATLPPARSRRRRSAPSCRSNACPPCGRGERVGDAPRRVPARPPTRPATR